MSNVVVNYSDTSSERISGTSIALTTSSGVYKHSNKQVASLAFDLDSATAGTITVAPSAGSMPAQTCSSGAAPSQALPFTADWEVSSAGVGTLTLTIPSSSSNTYVARLQITGGDNVDITLSH